MPLPAQLQRQVDAANARVKELADGTPGTADPADLNPPQEPVAAAPTPAPQEPARTAEPPATPPAEDENSETYAQRYRSLQGIFGAQKRQLDAATSRIANLENLIATMQQAQAAPAPAPQPNVTEKDVTDYGSDMVEFARRVARDENAALHQEIASLKAALANVNQLGTAVRQVVGVQQQTAEERFFESLGQQVPDWEVINDHPKFHTWLAETDPVFGLSRKVALDDARQSLDLKRVVSLFSQWKNVSGGTAPAPSAGRPNAAASQLERQIAPGRASAATSAPQPKQARTWTPHDVQAFYQDKMRGKFKGREAEMQAMEQDIYLAQREGRFQAGPRAA